MTWVHYLVCVICFYIGGFTSCSITLIAGMVVCAKNGENLTAPVSVYLKFALLWPYQMLKSIAEIL